VEESEELEEVEEVNDVEEVEEVNDVEEVSEGIAEIGAGEIEIGEIGVVVEAALGLMGSGADGNGSAVIPLGAGAAAAGTF
jgi:hypothetical protein